MGKIKGKDIILILLIIAVIASFGLGFFVGKNQVICKVCQPEEIDFSLFWEALQKLEEKFASPEKIDIQKIIYGAISGMVKSLEDPYTVFMEPTDAKKFLEDAAGQFEGVGMEIGIKKGELQVVAPLEGTPAALAGLRSGDKILKINDILTHDINIDDAVTLIRGKKGTEVTLTIFRNEWDTSKDITLVRDIIEIPSLRWELIDISDNEQAAYIKIYQFSQRANHDFARVAQEIIISDAEKIILDLRNNPGGYLEVAQEIGGWFLEKENIIAIEDFGTAREPKIYKAKGNAKLLQYPLVILINQGSASGSEILAGALRDNRQIKIIGEESFGKGSIQDLTELSDGSFLKITIANWLTPSGQLITEKGLEPDIKIEMTTEDYEADKDPQLDKAIEVIRDL